MIFSANRWVLSLALSAAVTTAFAEEKPEGVSGKKTVEVVRLYTRGPEIEKVKTEVGVSDAELLKIREGVAAEEKKHEAQMADPKIKALQDEVKAAQKKLLEATGGYNPLEAKKKAAYDATPDDKKEKMAKLLHYDPKGPKDDDDKK